MQVKKASGKVYGADLTSAEKKAMDLEIQRQLAEYDAKHILEIDAIILWQLHKQLGFGLKRLKRFFDTFNPAIDALIKRYELEDGDQVWLCTHQLKEYGIDLEKWEREQKENM